MEREGYKMEIVGAIILPIYNEIPKNCGDCPYSKFDNETVIRYVCDYVETEDTVGDYVDDYMEGDKRHPDCKMLQIEEIRKIFCCSAGLLTK